MRTAARQNRRHAVHNLFTARLEWCLLLLLAVCLAVIHAAAADLHPALLAFFDKSVKHSQVRFDLMWRRLSIGASRCSTVHDCVCVLVSQLLKQNLSIDSIQQLGIDMHDRVCPYTQPHSR